MRTIFEYRYRDAGNFKAHGSIALDGLLSAHEEEMIRSKLESGEFFIAEQIGVPPLYEQLYQWSNGPIDTDHCWHEFVSFTNAEGPTYGNKGVETAAEFAARFSSIVQWDEALSRHFDFTLGDTLETSQGDLD